VPGCELSTHWETVVDTIQDGLMIVDPKGTIVSVNRALEAITGYTKAELVGSCCCALRCDICQIVRDGEREHWCALFRTGRLTMRRCMLQRKDGSYIYILKNAALLSDSNGEVIGAVETLTDITEVVQKDHQIEAFQRELRSEDGFHGIIGVSVSMQRVFNLIVNATESDAPVIVFGESGTGKDLVARAIHETGPRKRFEAARGGDIFLDDIGDLPLSTQVKLLRVLEEKVIVRVGENEPIDVNVRVISATNKNLRQLMEAGHFREDLFYRINVIPISLPPLRERIEDIPLLAGFFFRRIRMKSGKDIRGISNEAMTRLMEYQWPGNVRELKGAFEYAFISCHEPMIRPHHLPPAIFRGPETQGNSRPVSLRDGELKKRRLLDALERAGGNQAEAARLLGVSRVTVWNQMKKYDIRLRRGLAVDAS
jgi:two-component system response regulator HydG